MMKSTTRELLSAVGLTLIYCKYKLAAMDKVTLSIHKLHKIIVLN